MFKWLSKIFGTSKVRRRRWSDDEIELLKVHVNNGTLIDKIAIELGRTESAIRNKIVKQKNELNETPTQ